MAAEASTVNSGQVLMTLHFRFDVAACCKLRHSRMLFQVIDAGMRAWRKNAVLQWAQAHMNRNRPSPLLGQYTLFISNY